MNKLQNSRDSRARPQLFTVGRVLLAHFKGYLLRLNHLYRGEREEGKKKKKEREKDRVCEKVNRLSFFFFFSFFCKRALECILAN